MHLRVSILRTLCVSINYTYFKNRLKTKLFDTVHHVRNVLLSITCVMYCYQSPRTFKALYCFQGFPGPGKKDNFFKDFQGPVATLTTMCFRFACDWWRNTNICFNWLIIYISMFVCLLICLNPDSELPNSNKCHVTWGYSQHLLQRCKIFIQFINQCNDDFSLADILQDYGHFTYETLRLHLGQFTYGTLCLRWSP